MKLRRNVRRTLSLAAVCVLAGAAPLAAGEVPVSPPDAASVSQHDLSGRWEGRSYELARTRTDCGDKPCTLTLDIAKCASGWCGVEVTGEGEDRRCGATALKLDGGSGAEQGGAPLFKGDLSLAKGTEPYVVEVYLVVPGASEPEAQLQIVGDTGGEFRMFRRSFPFNATLAKVGEARCRPESTVSSLME